LRLSPRKIVFLMHNKKLTRLNYQVMINLGPNLEQYFQPVRMVERFPTTAYVAARLQKVGWDSVYGRSLLSNFRDELFRECGSEFSEVLKHFRLVSPC
jgi:hypothetical protein